jgi:hypothetical protein
MIDEASRHAAIYTAQSLILNEDLGADRGTPAAAIDCGTSPIPAPVSSIAPFAVAPDQSTAINPV